MATLTTGTSVSNDQANGYMVADGFSGPLGAAAAFPNGIAGSTPVSGAFNGTLGATTPNTAVVTTLAVNTSAVISPSGTVALSPTGALTVNPTAASTINNASIGATTALAGTFTVLTVNTSAVISPSGTVALSPTGALTVNPTAASTINNASIGVTTPLAGKFTTLTSTGLNTLNGGLMLLSAATPAAAGSTVTDATQLTAVFNAVTGANGTTGVKLPPTPAAGTFVVVKNNAGSTLKVWPDAAATINAISSNADLPVLTNAACLLFATSTTQWWSVPLVPS